MAEWGKTKWNIAERNGGSLIDHLLLRRGVSADGREAFLAPDFSKHLADPFLLDGMRAAVERIEKARVKGEIIGIFGDYDADGTPAAAILALSFRRSGIQTEVYLPKRSDGYGLSQAGLEALVKAGAKLIVSVDCGIASKFEVAWAREQGLDVIITDHHEIQADKLPDKAVAIINPKLSPEYPSQSLAGTAVAWKLLQALSVTYGWPKEAELKWLLDLVAVASIADMVSLQGETRLFVKYGLMVLKKNRRLGLSALMAEAGLDPAILTYQQIAYIIGPWLNAAGRADKPELALELLLSGEPARARVLAMELGKLSRERRQVIDTVWPEVAMQVAGQEADALITVASDAWPVGVVGLVASRLAREAGKFALVLARDGEGWRGSIRSGYPPAGGASALTLLESCAADLGSFGGHKGAAGVSIAGDKFEAVIAKLKAAASGLITPAAEAELEIDAALLPDEARFSTLEDLRQMEPFGMGNERPRFSLHNLAVTRIRPVGKTAQHLQLTVGGMRAVAWSTQAPEWLLPGRSIDVAFNLEPDTYTGPTAVQLVVEDARLSERAA